MRQSCRENRNTYFVFSNFFFLENRVFYEIMLKIIVEPDRPYDGMAQALCMLCT